MAANICPRTLPSHMTLGSKGEIPFFQNMVMLHIKYIEITKCSNMVATILPTYPSWPLGSKIKNQSSSEQRHVAYAYQIK